MTNIGVIFGGRSVEHRVSVVSARTVAAALREAGYKVVPMGIAQDGCWVEPVLARRALDGELDALEPVEERIVASMRHFLRADVEAVFPIIHGTWGEDGTLQGLLEMADVPYVGTGVASSAVCMDKILAKQVLQQAGIEGVDFEPVSRRQVERSRDAVLERVSRFEPPIFVKPAVGGSSVGVSRVTDVADLGRALDHALGFDDRVVVEKGIDGRELECAVLGYDEWWSSGVGEIVPGKEFYDYADKYIDDGAELIHQADLPAEVEEKIRELSIEAMEAVGGWGMARVDFLLESSADGPPRIYLNEINTLPGFTAISMYPKLWQRAGMEPPELVDRLVGIARKRHADRARLDRGIKEWIRSLG